MMLQGEYNEEFTFGEGRLDIEERMALQFSEFDSSKRTN
jgi:hypothetical protein